MNHTKRTKGTLRAAWSMLRKLRSSSDIALLASLRALSSRKEQTEARQSTKARENEKLAQIISKAERKPTQPGALLTWKNLAGSRVQTAI